MSSVLLLIKIINRFLLVARDVFSRKYLLQLPPEKTRERVPALAPKGFTGRVIMNRMKILVCLLALSVELGANIGYAKTVIISSYANGNFGGGYLSDTLDQPFVKAIAVQQASTIAIKYVSGSWCYNSSGCSGPNGTQVADNSGLCYLPLQEAT
jgi:hypothetical protein